MPSLMVCCPYPGVFSGKPERFPSWIDNWVLPDHEKEAGGEAQGPLLERM